jgi:NADPH-dependent ferric siderophore reductase
MRGPTLTETASAATATAELASRLGVAVVPLRVVDAAELSPSIRRIKLAADVLADIAFEPGQDLMLSVDPSGGARRRYTIRSLDRRARTVDLDVVVHGDGPGASWARSAQPGDRLEAIGPRGKVTLRRDAAWHLFVGDETFLPAALAMIEALRVDGVARAVIEVDGPADEQMPRTVADAEIVWLHRHGAAPGDPTLWRRRWPRSCCHPGAGMPTWGASCGR